MSEIDEKADIGINSRIISANKFDRLDMNIITVVFYSVSYRRWEYINIKTSCQLPLYLIPNNSLLFPKNSSLYIKIFLLSINQNSIVVWSRFRLTILDVVYHSSWFWWSVNKFVVVFSVFNKLCKWPLTLTSIEWIDLHQIYIA